MEGFDGKDTRECLFCGAPLSGRKDKKFCDDGCRNNHYYNVNKNADMSVKRVNEILLRNRSVLKQMCRGAKTMVRKQILVDSGFDFEHITALYKTRKNDNYRLVYDYAYKIVDDNVIVIRY